MTDNETIKKQISIMERADAAWSKIKPALPDPRDNMFFPYTPTPGIKSGRCGEYKISRTEKLECWDVINRRNAFMQRQQPVQMRYAKPVAFFKLQGPDHLFTSDVPNEQYMQFCGFEKAHGNVLVSGLGLGMAASMILRMPAVMTVTIVEKSPEIIKLAEPWLRYQMGRNGDRLRLIENDIFDYLKEIASLTERVGEPLFDFAYHDIWYGTGEAIWAATIVPLYRATQRANISEIGGWCEVDMQSQMFAGLFKAACTLPEHSWKPYKVFLDACRKTGLTLPVVEADEPVLVRLIKFYIQQVGTLGWEQMFSWDTEEGEKK